VGMGRKRTFRGKYSVNTREVPPKPPTKEAATEMFIAILAELGYSDSILSQFAIICDKLNFEEVVLYGNVITQLITAGLAGYGITV
jgi:hypothetical protein